jgi:hypothetical protein
MSDINRRSVLKGIATTGVATAVVGATGTAVASSGTSRTVHVIAQEDGVEYDIGFWHPGDSSERRSFSGTLSSYESAYSSTSGVISSVYFDGTAQVEIDTVEEDWFDEHNVGNPREKTIIGNNGSEYSVSDGTDNYYSGDLSDGSVDVTLDCGVDAMLGEVSGDGYVYLY